MTLHEQRNGGVVMKRLDPNGRTYQREAIQLAFDSCSSIYPCADCGHPVLSGYVCEHCGNTQPTERSRNEATRR